MPCPGVGPCAAWELDMACLDASGGLDGPCLAGGVQVTGAQISGSETAASQIMWALTGRQFGTCTVTVRPCSKSCFSRSYNPANLGPWPTLISGQWYNIGCDCGYASECGCSELQQVSLPSPVCSVSEVRIDGLVLDPSAYRVDDFSKLIREDGGTWPVCQNMNLPAGVEGTWSVTLTYGREVPQLVLDAASEIACEFLKSKAGQPCKLPQRLQTLSRQGVTQVFTDPQEFFGTGRTGFYLADLAIETFNPKRNARRPGVYSPDKPGWRVKTDG